MPMLLRMMPAHDAAAFAVAGFMPPPYITPADANMLRYADASMPFCVCFDADDGATALRHISMMLELIFSRAPCRRCYALPSMPLLRLFIYARRRLSAADICAAFCH